MPRKLLLILFLFIIIFIQSSLITCAKEEIKTEDYVNRCWWQKFNDPVLLDYIDNAAGYNKDILISKSRILQSRQRVREEFAGELPQVYGFANFIRSKFSLVDEIVNRPSSGYINIYSLPLFANYELDLWQKNRKKTLLQEENLKSFVQDSRTMYITVTTETASAYFNLLKLSRLIELEKEFIEVQKCYLNIEKLKFDEGLIPYNNIYIANKDLSEAQALLNTYEKQFDAFQNQLAVLTGISPSESDFVTENTIDCLQFSSNLPMEVPADMVLNRPDILKTEYELTKSKINVELARKDFLPDIYIFGAFGFNSVDLQQLFNWQNYLALVGTSLFQRIYTGGKRIAKLKEQKFAYEEMLQNYQKTILTSLQEVNDSLFALKTDLKNNQEYINRLCNEKKNLDLINLNYKNGLISYSDTISVRKSVIKLQQEQLEVKTECLIDVLNYYKALGGNL